MKKRILSIQGGGVNGIFAAQLLANIESALEDNGLPPRAGRYFDLIAGTSTGGLIALALAFEIPAKRIVEIYLEKSEQIFPKSRNNSMIKAGRYLLKYPWYSPDPLIKEMKEVFGDRKIGNAVTRLLIPAYQMRSGRVRIFKTAHHPIFQTDHLKSAWDVAAATAAAPVFFPPHQMEDGTRFIDGGVWANNPSLIAVIEAINYCKWPRDSLDVLSIGGIQDVLPASYWNRARLLPSAITKSQVDGTIAATKTLLGHVNQNDEQRGHFENFLETQPHGQFGLDNAASVREVAGFANDQYTHRREDILERYFSATSTNPFSPSVAHDE